MRLRCGEEVREATVRETREGLEVRLGETAYLVDVRAAGPGTFVLRQEGREQSFHCVRDGDEVHLFWKGTAYRLVIEREGAPRAHRHAHGGLEAPMPGKVIKVSVTTGQTVSRGDEILVVEAMKMENAIRTPRAGRVVSLTVKVGDTVSPGVVLAEIE